MQELGLFGVITIISILIWAAVQQYKADRKEEEEEEWERELRKNG